MKVAIINLAARSISGGYKKYVEKVVPLLKSNKKISDLRVYISAKIAFPILDENNIIYKWPHNDPLFNFKWLRLQIKNFSPDVIFIPTSRIININNLPIVIMVRNMEPLAMPFKGNPISERFINVLRNLLTKRACIKASRVIAVSNYVKNFLINRWKIDPNKIAVIYHGAESSRGNCDTMPKLLSQEDMSCFIFTAGSIRPARGLEDILTALKIICKKYSNMKLVIAGSVDRNMERYKSDLEKKIEKYGIKNNVIWASKMCAEEMAWCYKNCKIFVMTSRTEACPNIALEALTNGCICISTENDPMPEIFQNAAIYYPSKNPEMLANKIFEVLSWSEDKRKKFSEIAIKRSMKFSLENCVEKTVEQLEIAVKEFKQRIK